jgi:hypothetical protein
VPAEGFREDPVGGSPDALSHGGVALGPDPSVYAYVQANFQGNLFRIPLH